MKVTGPFVYEVKRRKAPMERRVRTVHDASKCVGLPDVRRAEPALYTQQRFAYAGKAQAQGHSLGQSFVYSHAGVFGTGNPRTIGASGGDRHIVSRRNVSNPRSLVD